MNLILRWYSYNDKRKFVSSSENVAKQVNLEETQLETNNKRNNKGPSTLNDAIPDTTCK